MFHFYSWKRSHSLFVCLSKIDNISDLKLKMDTEKKGYRLIFLDVDGVLNTDALGDADEPFVPKLLHRLARLQRETCANIVYSTAWRLTKETRQAVDVALLEYSLPLPLSCTPRMHGPRGQEVLAWLQHNTDVFADANIEYDHPFLDAKHEFGPKQYELPVSIRVEQFVILDDRDFSKSRHGGPYRKLLLDGHYIHIDPKLGITQRQVNEARDLLLSPLYNDTRTEESSLETDSGFCEYCEKYVKHGLRDKKQLFCKHDCAYRYRVSRNKL